MSNRKLKLAVGSILTIGFLVVVIIFGIAFDENRDDKTQEKYMSMLGVIGGFIGFVVAFIATLDVWYYSPDENV
jgi:amino acid transporter